MTLDDLLAHYRQLLHLPDPTAVLAALGTVAANRLPGDPVWTLLVGPPSSGKTEIIDSLRLVPKAVSVSTLTKAALLSGRTGAGVLVSSHVAYNNAETLPRRRLEVLGAAGLLVATDTMGQTAGGSVTLQRGDVVEGVPFDTKRSPFTAQVQAFADATLGQPHDFSAERDIRLMRLFDAAYQEAKRCL